MNFGAKIEIFEKLATIILKVQNETFFGDFQTKWEFSPSLPDFFLVISYFPVPKEAAGEEKSQMIHFIDAIDCVWKQR